VALGANQQNLPKLGDLSLTGKMIGIRLEY